MELLVKKNYVITIYILKMIKYKICVWLLVKLSCKCMHIFTASFSNVTACKNLQTFKVQSDGCRGFTKVVLGDGLVLSSILHPSTSDLHGNGVVGLVRGHVHLVTPPSLQNLGPLVPGDGGFRICSQFTVEDDLVPFLSNHWFGDKLWWLSLLLLWFITWS